VRIVLVDDHEMVIEDLRGMLAARIVARTRVSLRGPIEVITEQLRRTS
jgi:hypothetical protein